MTAPSFYDLIVMSIVGTPGTGDITLGAPKAPYLRRRQGRLIPVLESAD
jgi:hypothetical protein